MIPILPIINPLARLAAAALEHVNIRKRSLAAAEKQDQARRLKDLEDSDFEQARLISELSENVEQLAKAAQSVIDEHGTRRARSSRLLYLAVALSASSLIVALVALLK